jgi:hypothetical protein
MDGRFIREATPALREVRMRVLITMFAALCIVGYTQPSAAQYYYYGYNPYAQRLPSAQAPPSYGYYTTPNGWGERGSNGWTYHGGGFDLGRDSNGCIYTTNWSNC